LKQALLVATGHDRRRRVSESLVAVAAIAVGGAGLARWHPRLALLAVLVALVWLGWKAVAAWPTPVVLAKRDPQGDVLLQTAWAVECGTGAGSPAMQAAVVGLAATRLQEVDLVGAFAWPRLPSVAAVLGAVLLAVPQQGVPGASQDRRAASPESSAEPRRLTLVSHAQPQVVAAQGRGAPGRWMRFGALAPIATPPRAQGAHEDRGGTAGGAHGASTGERGRGRSQRAGTDGTSSRPSPQSHREPGGALDRTRKHLGEQSRPELGMRVKREVAQVAAHGHQASTPHLPLAMKDPRLQLTAGDPAKHHVDIYNPSNTMGERATYVAANSGRPGRMADNEAPGTSDRMVEQPLAEHDLQQHALERTRMVSSAGVIREVASGATGGRSSVGYRSLQHDAGPVVESPTHHADPSQARLNYVRAYFEALREQNHGGR
jgi:hypothetical protein